jgi:hypothetical protein
VGASSLADAFGADVGTFSSAACGGVAFDPARRVVWGLDPDAADARGAGAGSAGGSTLAGVSLGGSADRADRELDGRRDVVPAAALRVDRFFDVAIARPPFAGVDSPQAVDLHVRRRT